jgi:hypothetical protein
VRYDKTNADGSQLRLKRLDAQSVDEQNVCPVAAWHRLSARAPVAGVRECALWLAKWCRPAALKVLKKALPDSAMLSGFRDAFTLRSMRRGCSWVLSWA